MSTALNFRVYGLAALLFAGAAAWPREAAHAEHSFQLAAFIAEEQPAPRLSSALLVPLLSDVEDAAAEPPMSLLRLLKSTIAENDGADSATGFDEVAPDQPPAATESTTEPLKVEAVSRASPGVEPDFQIWQQRAKDKLKLEQGPKTFEHPLAKDNPADFIIVCEAGCRHDPDEIVSRVAKPERIARATGGFEPTSSSPDGDADQANQSRPDQYVDPAVIRCEAGCFGRTKSYKARLPRTATLDADNRSSNVTATASVSNPASRTMLAPQGASNGAIVGPHYAALAAEVPPARRAQAHVVPISSVVVRRTRHAFERGNRIAVPQMRRRRVAAWSD
ncbi:MAG: hypothetical protein ACKVP4_08750 [Hyphomicrobium sp.]